MHRQGLRIEPGDRVLSVAGAGDVVFGFLLDDPTAVVGLDVATDQIHLCELKACAIKHLSREETLQLLGYNQDNTTPSRRIKLYLDIKRHLPVETMTYWDERVDVIGRGVIHCGALGETPIHFMARNVLTKVFSKSDILQILGTECGLREALIKKSGCESSISEFCIRCTFAWYFWAMSFINIDFQYSPPTFYTWLNPLRLLRKAIVVIRRLRVMYPKFRENSRRTLRNAECEQVCLQEYRHTGDISGRVGLPDYLQDKNYELVKSRIERVAFLTGDIFNEADLQTVKDSAGGAFDAINLSNVPQPIKAGSGPAARNDVNLLFSSLEKVSKLGTRIVFLANQRERERACVCCQRMTWPGKPTSPIRCLVPCPVIE